MVNTKGSPNLFDAGDNHLSQELGLIKEGLFQLRALIQNLNSNQIDDPPLSEEQVAEVLGVCTRTVRNRLKERELEYSEIKGKRYVRQSELNRYLNHYLIPRKKAS